MMLLQEKLNVGEMVLHHTADAWTLDFYPLGKIHLPRFADVHLGPVTLNLSPTKHVVFMVLAAVLVFLTMKLAGRSLAKQRAGERAPMGFANAIEGLVLFVRNDICIANIGHGGARFAPLILSLFFFILYGNLLGLIPWGSSPTGNLAVTGALALLVLVTVEVAGFLKLGAKGYLGTIFPHFPGLTGVGATVMAVAMSPIELMSKLVKPFALAVRLFGNMTAGHFVILSLFGIVFLFGNLGAASWGIGIVTAMLVTGIMLLELIVAVLQAYVFALLSSVFIGLMQHEH
ncbi:MAG: F0F1 ATP synthase subunit A [Gemmatimonadota bacterium]|nr:F0F1 ATP synthase subunit A [Gemmatimonadota bacterium]MDH5283535.1 F0F1 ATP synthase subunit A [Gemmatimonadota bacterium]